MIENITKNQLISENRMNIQNDGAKHLSDINFKIDTEIQ